MSQWRVSQREIDEAADSLRRGAYKARARKAEAERDRYRAALEAIRKAACYSVLQIGEQELSPQFLVRGKVVVALVDEALGEKR
jgi:hypothetical protein